LDVFTLPVDDELVRRFKELSESLWEVNGFNSGQFAQAEVIPLVASAAEIDDEGAFRAATTEAVTADFEKLLGDIEFTMSLSVAKASFLRAIMVRVKSRCKIKPHIDDTFTGIPHAIYRCQLSGKTQLQWTDDVGVEKFSPKAKQAVYVPPGMIQEEENTGLNDSIHVIFYMQDKVAGDIAKELLLKQQLAQEQQAHRKIYSQGV
jgi:uncharacterized RmlC-like cupin family protein